MPLKKGKKLLGTKDGLKTLVAVVLDETGSMETRRDETISSVNFYLNGILDSDPTAIVTLAEFSDMGTTEEKVRFVEKNTPVTEVYELTTDTYRPRGNTPLYDAVGLTIRAVEREDVDRFLFVIVTDGFENSSREFNRAKIVDLITEKERTDKWTFVYLAAGQDAWAGASSIGISTRGTTRSYSGEAGTTLNAAAEMTASTRQYLASSKTAVSDFWEKDTEKTKLLKPKQKVSS